MFEESSLKSTGLVLCPVAAILYVVRASSWRETIDDMDHEQDQARWQPYCILISSELKKISVVDLCHPSDVHPEQLKAAAIRKQDGYS